MGWRGRGRSPLGLLALAGAATAWLAPVAPAAVGLGGAGGPWPVGQVGPQAAAQAAGSDQGDDVAYRPPVEAPISDPFRPPPQPWLPGNRGIEYATAAGTVVRAAGRGRVTFAGPVAGSLHVTVTHPDGIRTSYSFLATVAVVAGAEIPRGHVLGTTGARLHVGARRGDTYIDPASLWGATGPPWVRLAPPDGPVLRAPAGGTGLLVAPAGSRPRLVRRPWHLVRTPPPHSPVRQRSPSWRQDQVTSNRWERRSTWISPS